MTTRRGVIILIEDIERGKSDILGVLKDVRQSPQKRTHEFAELLEDKYTLDKLLGPQEISKEIKAEHNRRHNFYRAYIVYVFNHFIFDDDDVEIMLVAFNYHPDFAHETKAKYRRDLFARQIYELKHSTGWGDTIEAKDSGLRGEEARIMEELSETLAALAVKQGGTLDLVEEVLATLEPPNTEENDDTPEEIDEDTAPPSGDDPPPNPQGFKPHIGNISIGPLINISSKLQINAKLSWIKIPALCILAAIVTVALCMRLFLSPAPLAERVSSAQTFIVVNGDIIMSPNTYYGLVVASSLDKTSDSVFSYVSSDPSVVKAGEHNGMLQAPASHPSGGVQTADIIITDENGATTTKPVTVDFSKPSNNITAKPDNSGPGHNIQPDDFVPDFSVTQKIRIAGDTEWHNYVDAKVGDELEIQFEYQNTGENEHINVAVKDVLPANLGYIPGSTTLYTVKTPEGLPIDQDGLVKNGMYIGTYGSGSNAYIRFKVRVVDTNLADGITGLVNWSQACVNGVTLQDYATVRVTK